jgi:hypothetical protein
MNKQQRRRLLRMKKLMFLAAVAALALNASLWGQIITVGLPGEGHEWCIGRPAHTITWTSSGVSQPVTIALRIPGSATDAAPAYVIAEHEANDGAFSWEIPDTIAPGDYFIRVRSDDATVIGDGGVFTVKRCVNPEISIRVTSPLENITPLWCYGTPGHMITWRKSGPMQNSVTIALRVAGSATDAAPALVIATGEANDGSYGPWTIPDTVPAGEYFIRVRTDDATVIGDGNHFNIGVCRENTDLELRSIYYTLNDGGQIVGRIRNNGPHIDQTVGVAFTLIGSRGGLAPTTKRIHLDPLEERDYNLYNLRPESMPASGLRIRVNLDWGNHITESNETNNEQETRLCGLDISLQAPRSELSLHRLYAMGGEDYRIEFKIRVRHNLPQSIPNIRVYWDLIRVSSGAILSSYDHTIASLGEGEEHVWSVNETYGKSDRSMSKRPRLTEGAQYRIVARISDPHDNFCDTNSSNDQAGFSFTIGESAF